MNTTTTTFAVEPTPGTSVGHVVEAVYEHRPRLVSVVSEKLILVTLNANRVGAVAQDPRIGAIAKTTVVPSDGSRRSRCPRGGQVEKVSPSTKSDCGFCAAGITSETTGQCPIPTCGVTVHVAAASGDHGFPVEIMTECGQGRAAEAIMAIVEAAAYTDADRKLDARLAARTEAQIAADEEGQVEHGLSKDDFDLVITADGQSAHVSEAVAEEAVKLMAAIGLEVAIHPEAGVAG